MNSLGTLLKLPEFNLLGGIFSKLLYLDESLSGCVVFFKALDLFKSALAVVGAFFAPLAFGL